MDRAASSPDDARTFLVLTIGRSSFAVPIDEVVELVQMVEVTPVPAWTAPLLGVIDVRGNWIAVVDLGPRLGFGPANQGPSSFIVVLATRTTSFGLVVDAIPGIANSDSLAAAPLVPEPLPKPQPALVEDLVRAGGETIPFLDVEELLTREETGLVAAAGESAGGAGQPRGKSS